MELVKSGGWRSPRQGVYIGNSQVSVVQWGHGNHIRAYYQGSDMRISEKRHALMGGWYNGSIVDALEGEGLSEGGGAKNSEGKCPS